MGKNSKETAYQAVTTGILIYEADRETLLEYKSTLRMESDNICPDAKHRLAVPGRHSGAGDFYSLVRPGVTEKNIHNFQPAGHIKLKHFLLMVG